MNIRDNKHTFAVYVPQLSSLIRSSGLHAQLTINDSDLYHRIYTVLRLRHEEIILFDDSQHIVFLLHDADRKKLVEGQIKAITTHQPFTPAITMLLPVLKREAFADALYACVELGANTIIPVITAKTQRGEAAFDMPRARKIMIAAAEQSKNFTIPTLISPMPLAAALVPCKSGMQFYADPAGEALLSCMSRLAAGAHDCTIAVGPEGGFVADEIALLQHHFFVPCALTPTILRAQQAVALTLGAFRAAVSF